MGLFSRKTRHFGGVSNSRLLKDREYPRALKDSTASYIKDQPNMTNPGAINIWDYNNMGIEQSIVPRFRKAARYVQTDDYITNSGYKTSAILEGDVSKVRTAIENEMKAEIGSSLIINYMLLDYVDYAHLIRQILIEDYAYSPISNSLTIEGQDYWLSDAVLHLFESQDIDPVGYSFTAPEVPGRVWDSTRPYTEWVYAEDIPKINKYNPRTGKVEQVYSASYYEFKEQAVLSLIEKYTHEFYETTDTVTTTTTTIDPETNEEITETTTVDNDPVITDIYNNLPSGVSVREYKAVLEEEYSEVIKDTPEEKIVRVTKKYDSSYYPQTLIKGTHSVELSDYFTNTPRIPEMGEWHEGDDDQDVKDYIEDFENGLDRGDIFGSSYIISISYSYINTDEERVETYRTLVDNKKPNTPLGDILSRYDNIIMDSISIIDVGFFMPEIFYRQYNKTVDGNSFPHHYKHYKKYSKKLGIDYDDFIDELYEGMMEESEDKSKARDNWSKVRSVCIVFGVDIDTEDPFLYAYLFEFFKIHCPRTPGESKNPPKKIVIKDSWSTDEYGWDSSTRKVVTKSILKEGEVFKEDTFYDKKSELKNVSLQGLTKIIFSWLITITKQISPTECEVIEIINYKRSVKIVDEKWVVSGSKEYEEAALMVPVSPALLLRTYRSFKDKEAAIYKSMYVEFLTYVKRKDKWYQTGIFKFIAIAIGAAITFFFPPAFLATAALSTAASIAVSVIVSTAISMAVSFGIKLVVKAFGLENSRLAAIVIAVAAIAFGAYSAIGNLANLMKSFMLFFNKITVYMIQAANGLLNEATVLIGVEMEEEAKSNKQKLKDLETHADNMFGYIVDDSGDFGSNRNYISPLINIGMSIDQIMSEVTNYNRMSDVIDYNHNYVDYILALPTLEETIQSMHSNR